MKRTIGSRRDEHEVEEDHHHACQLARTVEQ